MRPDRWLATPEAEVRAPTWSKLHTQRLSSPQYRISDSHTRSLLIDLNRSSIRLDTDDLCASGQLMILHTVDRTYLRPAPDALRGRARTWHILAYFLQ